MVLGVLNVFFYEGELKVVVWSARNFVLVFFGGMSLKNLQANGQRQGKDLFNCNFQQHIVQRSL